MFDNVKRSPEAGESEEKSARSNCNRKIAATQTAGDLLVR